jgi:hypothetical protein
MATYAPLMPNELWFFSVKVVHKNVYANDTDDRAMTGKLMEYCREIELVTIAVYVEPQWHSFLTFVPM